MTSQIFISYSKKDKDFAWKLADDLADAGHKVWIDRSLQVGEDWKESIIKNLEEADEVIVILSSSAISSKWVQHEGSIAYGLKKKMYPVLIESLPALELPLWMNEFQYHSIINVEYESAFGTLHAALTPPNPIQDLLDQQVNAYHRTGDLMSKGLLELIKENRGTLTISQEAEKLIQDSHEKRQQEMSEQARRRAAEALAESSRVLSSLMAEGEVPEQVIMQLSQVVTCDRCALFLEDVFGVLQLLAQHGFPEDARIGDFSYHLEDNNIYDNIKNQSRPFLVQDIDSLQGWKQPDWVPKDRTWLGVPLNAKGKTIGMLVLSRGTGAAFNQDDVLLASNFAVQASIALENARLYQSTLSTADRFATLNQASYQIGANLDPEQVYVAIHDAARKLMPFESFVISLLDDETDEIEGVYLVDGEKRAPISRIPRDQGLSGRVISSGEPLIVYGSENKDKMGGVTYRKPDTPQSLIAVPMLLGGRAVGMLSVQSYQAFVYTEDDLQILGTLANQAIVAIQNGRLFHETGRLAQELERRVVERTAQLQREQQNTEILLRILTEVSSSLDLDRILSRTLALLNDVMGAEQGTDVAKCVVQPLALPCRLRISD
jgi:GAF domain-containing protein